VRQRSPIRLAVLFALLGGSVFLWAQNQDPAAPSPAPPKPPVISLEALEKRLVILERGRAQALANLNAYDGAIQEVQFWINWLKEQAKEAEAKKKQPNLSNSHWRIKIFRLLKFYS